MNSIAFISHHPLHLITIYINTIFFSIRSYVSEIHIELFYNSARSVHPPVYDMYANT